MNSTVAVLAAFVLFIIYIAAKGRLPAYMSVLFGTVSTDATQTGAGTVGGAVSGVVKSVTGTPGASVKATVSPVASGLPAGDYFQPTSGTLGGISDFGGGGDFASVGTGGLY